MAMEYVAAPGKDTHCKSNEAVRSLGAFGQAVISKGCRGNDLIISFSFW